MKYYTQLTLADRRRLNIFVEMKLKVSEIARRLNKHRSTIYRELARNRSEDIYLYCRANNKALERKSRLCNIQKYATLRTYIVCRLKEGWSPEQISGRLRRKKSKYTVCHETIYRYIYKKNNRLYRYLPYKKPKRLRVCARKPQLCRYGDIRIITERPENIDKRIGLGHWEGDRIEFAGTKEHSVTTLVERKTRLLLLIKNETKASTPVMNKICDKFNMAEKMACRSITFDQGSEFAAFPIAENELKCKVYYCHVHSPWEKGSNENMNGRLRRYLPSNINIRDIDQNQLNELERKMNNTPRKCLDYRTPNELFLNQYREFCRTWG